MFTEEAIKTFLLRNKTLISRNPPRKLGSSILCIAIPALCIALGPGCNRSDRSEKEPSGEEKESNYVPRTPGAQKKMAKQLLRIDTDLPPPPDVDAPNEGIWEMDPALEPGSYDVVRPVAVYREANTKSDIIGAVSSHTRLPRVQRVQGRGCSAGFFLRLAEGAYVCGTNLKQSNQPPFARREPGLGANKLTPGTYGYIRTGGAKLYPTLKDGYHDTNGIPISQSDTVRWAGKRSYNDMGFWRITHGQFVRDTRVRRFWPSHFQGVNLLESDKRLPLVFMVGRRRRKIGEKIPPIDVHKTPGGKVVSSIERHESRPVDDIKWIGDQRWFHIPGEGWVTSELTRLARLTDPPEGLHPRERWFDVDLDEQVLTVYRGPTPVYTTLVSAGTWKHPTPTGVFRIYNKRSEADMRSDPTADDQYRVDHVPWAMYFKGPYAMHGAYWHNAFGHARSRGCINLAPKDAEFVYHFARPKVPKGWTAVDSDENRPGTAIRIRGASRKEDDSPHADTEEGSQEEESGNKGKNN